MNETFQIGQRVELAGSVKDLAGTLTDPATVTFRIKKPDGSVTTYVYGTDPELERTGVGLYRVEWPVAISGVHWYRFETTGAVETADEASFTALGSKVL